MRADLVVKSDRIVFPDEIAPGALAVKDGRIVSISEKRWAPQTFEVLDATGRVVFPGVIDPHVHAREPGTEDREDFATCSRGAAAGGVTTFLEQPVSVPPTWNVANLRAKKARASAKSVVDFGLYGGVGITSLDQLAGMVEEGVCAFKTFLHEPYPGREKEFEGIYATDDGDLLEVFAQVAQTGRLQCVHAENNAIIQRLEARLREQGRVDPLAYVEARPVLGEVETIRRCIHFAQATGVRLHILHVSCAEGIEAVAEARERGMKNVTLETCPHYLWVNETHVREKGPYARISPPIRTRDQNERMWKLLAEGRVDTLGSDHAPHTKEDKERGWQDIFRAPAGSAGIEQMLPLMLHGVNEGKIDLRTLAKVMCENVARLYGLAPRKGALRIGADADMVIVDMEREHTFRAEEFQVKARDGALLYDGWRVQGMPDTTIVRGRIVFDRGRILGEPGYGRFIPHQDCTRDEAMS